MTANPLRKGWCPTMLKPMETGDGLLVRITMTSAHLSAKLAHAIAKLAERHGNGQIDLTSRGNLQLRGVTPESYDALVSALMALGVTQEERLPRQEWVEPPVLGFSAKDGSLALGLLFGRMDARALSWLSAIATDGIRLSQNRTVYVSGIETHAVPTLLAEAQSMQAFLQKRMTHAAPSMPAPAHRPAPQLEGDTRALAQALAAALPDLAARGKAIHISGCTKGCARSHIADAVITLLAKEGIIWR